MVAMFLHVLAYIVKNRVIQREFVQSDEIVSRHFNLVLLANCFGTLDRMYIKVNVPQINPLRYRTRKGEVATNVLEVCETKGDFIFVLTGWKGSVADLHILRDALSRPNELEMTNADDLEDIDKGDSAYVTTIGDEIHYIKTLNEWTRSGMN
ncbi:putative nuclease HARBI1 [Cucumis melo var. makuwa]|uniref:Nuclease HARBI1 n=1 Tax=Cucumis melo var. makuwa TaxID=1194695 RepID=A0A5A7TEE7_CUCMM|nr:putative nuclease HARBI1 [Cucumis melo var. makuwa]